MAPLDPRSLDVLLIEDSPGEARLIQELLGEAGYARFSLRWTDCLAAGLARLAEARPDVILLNPWLPDGQDLATVSQVHARAPGVPIVVLASLDDDRLAAQALQAGAQDYLVKGQLDDGLLVRSLRYAVERHRSQQALHLLAEASQAFAEAGLDYEAVLRTVVQRISEAIGDACFVRLLSDDRQWVHTIAVHHPDPGVLAYLRELTAAPQRADEGLGRQVVETGQPILLTNVAPGLVRAITPEWFRRYIDRVGNQGLLLVPLRARDRVIGTLGLARDGPGRPYSSEDQTFLQTLANRAALSIENARLHRALELTEQRFRAIFDHTFEFIGLLEPDGTLLEANQTALDFVGLSREQVVGRPFWETAWWDGSSGSQERLKASIAEAAEGQFVRFETRHRGADGRLMVVDFSLKPARDETGRVVLLIPEGRDITERKRAEDERDTLLIEAQSAEARYRSLFEGSAAAILVGTMEGRCVEANTPASELLGYSREDLLQMNVREIFRASPEWIQIEGSRSFEDGHWDGELEVRRKDGSLVPVEAHGTVVQLPTGVFLRTALHDISERRVLERMQQEFIAMVTHELRNPLAAIRAYAQLLDRNSAYDERATGAILRQTHLLERLIGDLLDAARLEAGRLQLQRASVDLVALLNECLEQSQAQSRSHTLQLEAPAGQQLGWWDRGRLEQVFDNLLSNAIKYSPAGGAVQVRLDDLGEQVRVSITDHGMGIPAEALPRLFQRFERAEAADSGVKGLGLGLYIARSLVEAHAGRIEVESGVGRGSTFTITLPRGVPDPAPPEQVQPTGLRVLVVDDDQIVQEHLAAALTARGYEVNVASNGQAALDILGVWRPTIIVLDLMMPEMDAWTFRAQQRTLCEDADIPVVIVSAVTPSASQLEALGPSATFHKPVDDRALLSAIDTLVHHS